MAQAYLPNVKGVSINSHGEAKSKSYAMQKNRADSRRQDARLFRGENPAAVRRKFQFGLVRIIGMVDNDMLHTGNAFQLDGFKTQGDAIPNSSNHNSISQDR